jgi:hypothetical protein
MRSSLLAAEEDVFNEKEGKIMRWYTQTGFITIIADVVSMFVGILGIVDAFDMSEIGKYSGPLHYDWFKTYTGLLLYTALPPRSHGHVAFGLSSASLPSRQVLY